MMGEIADMVLDGTMCQGCGEFIDDDEPGYPRYCEACEEERPKPRPRPQHRCPQCDKRLRSPDGVAMHMRDKHEIPGGDRQRIRPDENKTEFPT